MFYDSESALFWYRAIFMGELLISEILFTWRLSKRRRYILRLLIGCAACIGLSFAVPIFSYNSFVTSGLFFFLFFISVVMFRYFCYKESWQTVLFYCVAAFAVQHIAYELYNFIVIASDLNNGLPVEVYGDKFLGTYNAIIALVQFVSYFIVYWAAYMLIGRRDIDYSDTKFSFPMFMLSSCTVVISIGFNAAVTYYAYEHVDRFYLSLSCLLIITCCILALYAQFGLLFRRKIKRELDFVKTMWLQEKKQYRMLKENIDYINIKCHDLRHQISNIGKLRSLDEKSIREIQNVISIYDSSLKTGNEALDVMLMEKTLLCRLHGIRITCIADGKALSFMEDSDIYSLFGNALDNAVEALRQVEDEEKRVIGLDMRRVEGFLTVRIYNYCPVKLVFYRGLPQTSNNDKYNHGFGLKSMRMIVEKYGGNFRVSQDGDTFNINIIFPCGEDNGQSAEAEE